MTIKYIAFDADDTLWINEPYFQQTEQKFCALLDDFMPHHSLSKELLQTEIANLPLYGYGVKGFTLSMIETAIQITGGSLSVKVIAQIINLGKELLEKPIELLDGVEKVLSELKGRYRLVVATKGDLLDQERKLQKSGLAHFFHHIEIMSDKKEADYLKLIKHLDIEPSDFLMVGNSVKSDILPVLNIGGYAFHVPFHTTWEHEKASIHLEYPHFKHFHSISEILTHLKFD
jgi:putative hydrolase of the HAD superfamily